MGNRLTSSSVTSTSSSTSSYQANRLNQITGISTIHTGGSANTSSARIYDADGNLVDVKTSTSGGVTSHKQYVYDDANRLTEVITLDPLTDANEHKSTFTIDGFSRVAITTEYDWNGTAWTKVSRKHYVYDGLDPYVELSDSQHVQKILLRGGNGEILAEPLDENIIFPEWRYYFSDGSGSVSDVVRMVVDTPVATGHYDYDAYGNLLSATGDDADSNYYRYSGKEYIPNVGMYNYGYRFYSPGMGRWINRDPLSEAGGLNLYGFVGNNPVNYVDSYGLFGEGAVSYFKDVWRGLVVNPLNYAFNGDPNALPIPGMGVGSAPGDDTWAEIYSYRARQGDTLERGSVLASTAMRGYGEAANQLMIGSAVKGIGMTCSIARSAGVAGERAVGINGPKTIIRSITGTARYRIPDRLTSTTLEEVKNVRKLYFTRQLKDFLLYTEEEHLEFVIYTNARHLSRSIQTLEREGRVIIRPIPK